MSVSIIKHGNGLAISDYKEILISNESDLADMPDCSVGSIAYLSDLSKLWMKDNEGNWNEI